MTLPRPWVFAVVGAAFVITSAALSGFYTPHLERAEADAQRKIREIDDNIAWCRERLELGSQKLSSAELKLLLLDSIQPPEKVVSSQLKKIANEILQGIVYRHAAATGDIPSKELKKKWSELAGKFALSELGDISSRLLEDWTHHNNELVEVRNEHKAEAGHTRRKISRVRFVGVALQILGLAIVLMKDLPRPANTPLQPTSGGRARSEGR